MTFLPITWQIRRARVAYENWNSSHPNDLLSWETVEEMLLAWRGRCESCNGHEALDYQQRYEEFARKLPLRLREEIFPPS